MGIFPGGTVRDVLIRSSIGEALPVALDPSAYDEPLPMITWNGLRLMRKGRESGYNFWSNHNVLTFDLVVILVSNHHRWNDNSPVSKADELDMIQKQVFRAITQAESRGRVTVMLHDALSLGLDPSFILRACGVG